MACIKRRDIYVHDDVLRIGKRVAYRVAEKVQRIRNIERRHPTAESDAQRAVVGIKLDPEAMQLHGHILPERR